MPFEDEVGPNPTLEEMKEMVVDKCQRPTINSEWIKHHVAYLLLLFSLFTHFLSPLNISHLGEIRRRLRDSNANLVSINSLMINLR